MARPVWLALIFLIGIGALAALKVSIARPAKQQAALADEVPDTPWNALAKADKLDVEEIPDRKIIRSVAIVSRGSAPQQETKIISRRGHEGYAKAKKTRHYHKHASRKKQRRG
jgi:hypothetical protein